MFFVKRVYGFWILDGSFFVCSRWKISSSAQTDEISKNHSNARRVPEKKKTRGKASSRVVASFIRIIITPPLLVQIDPTTLTKATVILQFE